jgi:hypothetical protein
MSQENVELVYRAADAFNRRDIDAALILTDDDVEVAPRVAAIEGGYHGRDGIRRWWGDVLGSFPDANIEVVEARDVGDLTIAATRFIGRGAGSDTPIIEGTVVWQVARFRRGKVIWWASFGTRAEALDAVGLSEQDVQADS